MSKRRSIILSVVLEGRSQAETARRFEVTEAWVSKLMADYRQRGEAAFVAKSRRPRTSPTRIGEPTVERIVGLRDQLTRQGLDAGPETIRWHLQREAVEPVPSVSTIRRCLIAANKITPEPRKRPRSSYIRFEADLPDETWQTDMTHWRLADGKDVELLSWLDDHSRFALSVTAHGRVNGHIVVDTFQQASEFNGFPASVLSDNAMYFTTRFSGGKGGRNHLETLLVSLNIEQKHSRPNRPTTCGKVERFQQTLKKWLREQPRAATIEELQDQLDAFVEIYKTERPHRSLGKTTPAVAYTRLPKTGPAGTSAGSHHRIRRDKVDSTGKITIRYGGQMFRIGIGRGHKHQPVIALIDDLNIRIIHANTGEKLRSLLASH